MAAALDDGGFPEEMEPLAVAYNLRAAAEEIKSLRAQLDKAQKASKLSNKTASK